MDELYSSDLYPGYRFTKSGKIYTHYNSPCWRELKQIKRSKSKKYYCVWLKNKDGIFKQESVHRVIAKVFIPNPENLPQVNHKDENPANNAVDNLEWCTQEYNLSYGTLLERNLQTIPKTWEAHQVPVVGRDEYGNEFYFESLTKAAKAIGRTKSSIWRHLNPKKTGKSNKCGGYVWEYAQRKEIEYG
jgi:hypothetical protein